MKEHENKDCKLTISVDDNTKRERILFFNARVLTVSEKHITFRDKYGDVYTFKRDAVLHIKTV